MKLIKNNLGRKGVIFITSISLFLTEGSQGRNLQVEVDRVIGAFWLAFYSLLICFLTDAKATNPGVSLHTVSRPFPSVTNGWPTSLFHGDILSVEVLSLMSLAVSEI